jgi:molybdenum cofactor synthesis domain-containing protein
MDGFAVRSEDVANAPVELKIVGESAAGRGWHHEMKRGEAVRIMTGAPVPQGADTVQKVELTSEHNFASDSAQRNDGKITINEPIATDKNIVRRGAEIKKGDRLFEPGEPINERMIATLAAFGYSEVSVAKRPRVSVFTTGSEVVEINETPGADQIRNSNSAMLKALAEPIGADVTLVPTAVDDLEAIKKAISSAAANSNMIVITGGVSVGKYDLTKTALIELGAEVFFDRVRLKPGKPAVFARLGQTLVFGLPGNPMSAAVTFYLFVRKALLRMQSAKETDLRRAKAVSGGSFKAARERDTYFPARLDIDSNGRVIVSPVKWIGSSDFIGFGRSDALAFVPGGEKVEKGDPTEILLL